VTFQRQQYYSVKDCRDIVQAYVKQQELDQRKGMVKVDPILMQILTANLVTKDNEVPKDILLKA
jgi:hypothetical protein